jgi:hypothetical protein
MFSAYAYDTVNVKLFNLLSYILFSSVAVFILSCFLTLANLHDVASSELLVIYKIVMNVPSSAIGFHVKEITYLAICKRWSDTYKYLFWQYLNEYLHKFETLKSFIKFWPNFLLHQAHPNCTLVSSFSWIISLSFNQPIGLITFGGKIRNDVYF